MNRTDSNTGQCTKLFLKVAPTEERVRENVRARVCFIQEIYVYTEVWKIKFMRKFWLNPSQEIFTFFAIRFFHVFVSFKNPKEF